MLYLSIYLFKLYGNVMVTRFADRLLNAIDNRQNPSCVGLDPRIGRIPEWIKKENVEKYGNTKEAVARSFLDFNKLIIDATWDIVPAYKPQMAFYEKYQAPGVQTFVDTVNYIKSKGRIAIEDAKRNDIGSTAQAYSDGHLGRIELCNGKEISGFDVDIITVNPYLGIDGVKPFIESGKKYGKGIFVLVKTSNPSSGDIQDRVLEDGRKMYELVGELVDVWGEGTEGERCYKSIGAVVGATYPEEAKKLRQIMPKTLFLVPGYGAQGGGAKDALPCFNKDGYGAIVNSSRGIIFAYQREPYKSRYGPKEFDKAARDAVIDMKEDMTKTLFEAKILPW